MEGSVDCEIRQVSAFDSTDLIYNPKMFENFSDQSVILVINFLNHFKVYQRNMFHALSLNIKL